MNTLSYAPSTRSMNVMIQELSGLLKFSVPNQLKPIHIQRLRRLSAIVQAFMTVYTAPLK